MHSEYLPGRIWNDVLAPFLYSYKQYLGPELCSLPKLTIIRLMA